MNLQRKRVGCFHNFADQGNSDVIMAAWVEPVFVFCIVIYIMYYVSYVCVHVHTAL